MKYVRAFKLTTSIKFYHYVNGVWFWDLHVFDPRKFRKLPQIFSVQARGYLKKFSGRFCLYPPLSMPRYELYYEQVKLKIINIE